ncbi:MAG: HupE/UreJ family protein [Pseudomonadales bacterium]
MSPILVEFTLEKTFRKKQTAASILTHILISVNVCAAIPTSRSLSKMSICRAFLPSLLRDSALVRSNYPRVSLLLFAAIALLFFSYGSSAHDVSPSDRDLINGEPGMQFGLYCMLGAKHMVTGYDHLLFLVGVVFYLRRIREIAIFVSLFALGHTLTLISGVLFGLHVNPYVVDAIIGLSVAYKGFDNLGGFRRMFGETPDVRLAVFIFGLFHGLGLASKLQDLGLHSEGLYGNLIAFNVGVELGQFAVLLVIVVLIRALTRGQENELSHNRISYFVNGSLVVAGFALMTYQLSRFWGS